MYKLNLRNINPKSVPGFGVEGVVFPTDTVYGVGFPFGTDPIKISELKGSGFRTTFSVVFPNKKSVLRYVVPEKLLSFSRVYNRFFNNKSTILLPINFIKPEYRKFFGSGDYAGFRFLSNKFLRVSRPMICSSYNRSGFKELNPLLDRDELGVNLVFFSGQLRYPSTVYKYSNKRKIVVIRKSRGYNPKIKI